MFALICSELTNKEEALVATKLGKLRLNAEMNQAQEEADLLHQENEKLLVEKAAATEELLATKMYLASLANVRFFSLPELFVWTVGILMLTGDMGMIL